MRKTVILCEGVHDLAFLSLILKSMDVPHMKKTWDQISESSNDTPESTIISDFLGRRGKGYSHLLKQDKDCAFCTESFLGLYKTGNSGYDLKMVADSDGDSSIRKIRRMMMRMIGKDVLITSPTSSHVLCWKSAEMRLAIFLYPQLSQTDSGKLTQIVKEANCGNLGGCRDENLRRGILEMYLDTEPDWISGLKEFLVG